MWRSNLIAGFRALQKNRTYAFINIFGLAIGLAACLLAPVLPAAAAGLAWIAWVPASWIAAVATFTAALPGARSPWPTGPLGIGLLVLVSVGGVALLLRAGGPRTRTILRATMVVALVAYAGTVAGGRIAVQLARPGDWEFALCDVGQGDASIVRSEGQVAVIDTGPEPGRLAACLDELGIGRIALLVLTMRLPGLLGLRGGGGGSGVLRYIAYQQLRGR